MTITVQTTRYGEEATYYTWDKERKYKNYEPIEKHTFEVEAESVQEAEKWLANNHPELYMGAGITDHKGNFIMTAVPSLEYGEGNYETTEARIAWVKQHIAYIA